MTAKLSNITFDCADAATLAGFWSQVLGRPLATSPAPSEHFASIGAGSRPRRRFPLVLPQGPGAQAGDQEPGPRRPGHRRPRGGGRLVALGATRVDDKDEFGLRWTVLRDPEGNEFCVAGPEAVQTPGAGAGAELSAPPRWTRPGGPPGRCAPSGPRPGPSRRRPPAPRSPWGGPAARSRPPWPPPPSPSRGG